MKVRTSVLRGFALLALSTFAFTACDEKATTEVQPDPVTVEVTPDAVQLTVGQSTGFVAVVRNTTNTAVTWQSGNTAIATVSATGVVQAVAPGITTITATSSADATARDVSTVTVVAAPVPVVNISVVPTSASMLQGQTLQLVPIVTGTTNTAVTYTTGDAAIATVSTTGVVTAVGAGTTVIRAISSADPTKFATSVITVTAVQPPQIVVTITPSQATGQVGQQVGFSAAVSGTTNQAVNWTSTVPAVATVNAQGVATLLSAGTTVIRATSAANGTSVASATLTVTPAPTQTITVSIVPTQVTLAPGQTQAFAASSSAAGDVITYTSSNNNVVTVDANGVATAVAQGSAVITARSTQDPNRFAQAIVTVTAAPPVVITVNPTNIAALGTGASTQIIATITGTDNQNVTCSSASTAIATVTTTADGRGCVVTGVAAGATVITVASAADPSRVQTVPVTVVGSSVAIAGITPAPNAQGNTVGTFVVATNVSVPAGTADRLEIVLTGPNGTFTFVCQNFTAAGAATTVACPINPADLDPNTAGAQVLPNGTYTVQSRLMLGSTVAASATFGTPVTTLNVNTIAGTVVFNNMRVVDTDNIADNETEADAAGNLWFGGDATVTIAPSVFTFQNGALQQITQADVVVDLNCNGLADAGEPIRTAAAASGWAVTFPEDVLLATVPGGVDDLQATTVCFTVINARQVSGGQTFTVQLGGAGITGVTGNLSDPASVATPTGTGQNRFRIDNVEPFAFAPTIPATVLANNNYAGISTTFTTATVGGLPATDGGVGNITYTFFAVPTGNVPGATQANLRTATTSSGAMAITQANQLPESTVSNTAYTLIVRAVDGLGNVRYQNAGTFGVDLTVPNVSANAATSAGDNTTNPAINAVDLRITDTFSGPRVVRTSMTLWNVFEADWPSADVDVFCVTDNAGTVAPRGAAAACPTFDVAVTDVGGITEQALINFPVATGEAFGTNDGTPDEGYLVTEIRAVDRAGNVSTDVVTRTVLLDRSNPGGTVDQYTVITATNSISLQGTLGDDVELESWDVRYNFTGLTTIPTQVPFEQPTVIGTYGLPLVSSDATESVVAANAINIREVDDGGVRVNPDAVGFGVWDIADNFNFVSQALAFGGGNGTGLVRAEYETAGTMQFDLDVAASGSGSENAITLDRSAGPTTTNLTAVVEVGATDQNPVSRVYFYFVHPGADMDYATTADNYLVLIGQQTASSVFTGVTERTFTFTQPVNSTVGGTFPVDAFTYRVVALAVDAQGDAIVSDQPTVRIQP